MCAVELPDPTLNALWCRCIAEELRWGGVSSVVLCPGSRNSPLLFALAATFAADVEVVIDERAAGFIALGRALASGRAVAVCVTSGSAVANLHPAMTEAAAAGVPLIVLSADRPWEAVGVGAPQAMAQAGLFAGVEHLDLGEPSAQDLALRMLRARISRAAQGTIPVQINVPLRDPLPPLPDPAFTLPPLSSAAEHGRTGPYTHCMTTWSEVPASRRPLVLAGAQHQPEPALTLALRLGAPVLADAPGGLRRHDAPEVICHADALVQGRCRDLRPDLIIQVGPMPLARPLFAWLDACDCPWLVIEDTAHLDWLARASHRLQRAALDHAVIDQRAETDWLSTWQAADAAARSALGTTLAAMPWSALVAADAALHHAGFAWLSLASSMSVRYANLLLRPGPARPVHCNRGVNGIDGTIATFCGAGRAAGPGLLLIGDVAALHDHGALLAASGNRGAIVILDDDGGGIFDFLPVAQVAGYQHLVRTPHGRDLGRVLSGYDLPMWAVQDRAGLTRALDAAASGDRLHLIHCVVRDDAAVSRLRSLVAALGNH